jgi:hypothetical protein
VGTAETLAAKALRHGKLLYRNPSNFRWIANTGRAYLNDFSCDDLSNGIVPIDKMQCPQSLVESQVQILNFSGQYIAPGEQSIDWHPRSSPGNTALVWITLALYFDNHNACSYASGKNYAL